MLPQASKVCTFKAIDPPANPGNLKTLSHMTSPWCFTRKIQAPPLHGDDLKVISVKSAQELQVALSSDLVVRGPGFLADILHKDLNLKNNKSQR